MTDVEMNATTLCAYLYNIHCNPPGEVMILLDFAHVHGGDLFSGLMKCHYGTLCRLYGSIFCPLQMCSCVTSN